MSRQTMSTPPIYGDVTFETVTCAVCEQDHHAEEMYEFVVARELEGETRSRAVRWTSKGPTYTGHLCPFCADHERASVTFGSWVESIMYTWRSIPEFARFMLAIIVPTLLLTVLLALAGAGA